MLSAGMEASNEVRGAVCDWQEMRQQPLAPCRRRCKAAPPAARYSCRLPMMEPSSCCSPLPQLPAEVQRLVDQLGMEPHPEGGFYKETFRDAALVNGRAASTAILYLLPAGAKSKLHRLDASECWHSYLGELDDWCRRGQASRGAWLGTRGVGARRQPSQPCPLASLAR